MSQDGLFDGGLYAQGPPSFERACLDARSVECPTCGADVGAPCARPSGHRAMAAHAMRINAAREALDEQERRHGG